MEFKSELNNELVDLQQHFEERIKIVSRDIESFMNVSEDPSRSFVDSMEFPLDHLEPEDREKRRKEMKEFKENKQK